MSDLHLPRRMLPGLQVIALFCLGVAAVLYLPWTLTASRGTGTVAIIWLILLVVISALWILRARVPSPRTRAILSVTVVLLATPVALFGRVGFTVPLLLLVVALVVLDVSLRAGVIATAWIGGVGLILHVIGQDGALTGIVVGMVNTVPIVVLLCFGLVLGATLRAYEERLENLRRAAETEKELLLADERARSARELHDGLGHRLTIVSMSLDYAARMRDQDEDAAWQEVAAARSTSQEALGEMRTWVRALSPVRDPEARGAAALEAIADSFRGTGLEVGMSVDQRADELLREDDATSLLAYRTVQEGLTNALRHGRARQVRIDVRDEQGLRLWICNDLDDRARKEIPEGDVVHGFGVRGITERAVARGGSVRAARQGERFVLELDLPTGRQR